MPQIDLHKSLVVSGLPRSGTSLMMQMLKAGGLTCHDDSLRPPDRHNPRGYFEHSSTKRAPYVNACLEHARAKVVKVVAPLLTYLPTDHIGGVIWMQRDLAAVCASQNTMLSQPPTDNQTFWLAELGKERDLGLAWLKAHKLPYLTLHYEDCLLTPQKVAAALTKFWPSPMQESAMAKCVEPDLCHHASPSPRHDINVTIPAHDELKPNEQAHLF
jgi:hypothetical protein